MTENTNIVQFDEQLRRELANLKNTLPPPSGNKIKTKGKLFTLPSGQSHPGPMSVVVLDYTAYNEFYPGVYNAKNPVKPVCVALNKVIDELTPSPESTVIQGAECDTCPKGQWGSAATGKGKACKNQWKLLLTAEDFNLETEPLTLYVSPSGMKHWTKYVRDLGQIHQMLPVQVLTEISFDANEAYPTLLFKLLKPHGKLEVAMALRLRGQELLMRVPEMEPVKAAAAA